MWLYINPLFHSIIQSNFKLVIGWKVIMKNEIHLYINIFNKDNEWGSLEYWLINLSLKPF